MRQLKISKSITNREQGALDKYLADIAKEPMISPDEEVELAQRNKATRLRSTVWSGLTLDSWCLSQNSIRIRDLVSLI